MLCVPAPEHAAPESASYIQRSSSTLISAGADDRSPQAHGDGMNARERYAGMKASTNGAYCGQSPAACRRLGGVAVITWLIPSHRNRMSPTSTGSKSRRLEVARHDSAFTIAGKIALVTSL